MRILVLSDIDDFHWQHGTGKADIVLSCGDVPDQVIIEAANAYGCSTILAVKGNHDSTMPSHKLITYLHLKTHEYMGLKFGGLNGSWKYKPVGHFLYEQHEVQTLLASFPPVDVFLSHNSPRKIHDKEDEVHYGFDGLNSYILKNNPKILIHGHQHINKESQLKETRIVGVLGYKIIEI